MEREAMNLLEFEERFRTEQQCIDYLRELRWPNGFVCPNCGHDDGYRLSRHALIQCTVCRRQTSITAGTIFEKTHMPLRVWFRMIWCVAQDKGGASSTRLAQQFGTSQKTAWHMLHKIRTAMASRNRNIQLGGNIELDEAFFNKEARKYEPHPKTETQVLVLVESEGEKAGQMVMRVIDAASRDNIRDIVNQYVEPAQRFVADGWHAHWVLKSMGHVVDIEPLSGEKAVEKLPWVHTMISNSRRFLMGTYHGVSPKQLQLFLDEFVFRANRRFRQSTLYESLLRACAFALPTTYAELKL